MIVDTQAIKTAAIISVHYSYSHGPGRRVCLDVYHDDHARDVRTAYRADIALTPLGRVSGARAHYLGVTRLRGYDTDAQAWTGRTGEQRAEIDAAAARVFLAAVASVADVSRTGTLYRDARDAGGAA